MPKSIQTRFVGIRDNHNHYTSLRLLFSIITDLLMLTSSRHAILDYYRPIDVDLFNTCYPWSVLDLHMEEIYVLSVSQF